MKIQWLGTELELNAQDIVCLGGYSFTATQDTQDYNNFVINNAQKCLDYKTLSPS